MESIKLHIGCGTNRRDGYINIDCYHTGAEDLVLDVVQEGIPFKDVGIIESYHFIDCIYKFEAIEVLKKFYNVLKVGGKMIMEMSTLEGSIKFFQSNDPKMHAFGKWGFFGDQDKIYPGSVYHKYVWEVCEMRKVLLSIGFKIIKETNKTETHVSGRDYRFECIKINESTNIS